jgi:hypothetical protein
MSLDSDGGSVELGGSQPEVVVSRSSVNYSIIIHLYVSVLNINIVQQNSAELRWQPILS